MKRALAWFAENRVAANLLMVLILGGGLFMIPNIILEVFPEFSADTINISVIYRGAAPEEVAEAVCVRVEEAVQGLEGIKRITSIASENSGSVNIEVLPGTDLRKLLDDVKTRVDAIDTFPDETEKPIVREVVLRRQVINVAVSGPADEATLKSLGEQVRDDISAIPGISQVKLTSARPYEVSIEVSENALRSFGLTFDEVARAVRRSSIDLPGGSIRTSGGEILLRTKGQAYRGPEFESIVIRTRPDGTHLTLKDVATVVDGFAETDQSARFDGHPSVIVVVFRVGDENALAISNNVNKYVEEAQLRMPEGIAITTFIDFSRILNSRLDLMLRNGRAGFILVFIALALLLRLRLAFWVALGIPISFLGAISMMPTVGATINLLSLFAFIVVLGIVVDDAIIIGENIFRHLQMGKSGLKAAIDGVQEVSVPVIFAVLTSIAAFSPLLMVGGTFGKFMRIIPQIVILTLCFSLIESLLILPAHLAHSKIGGSKEDDSRRRRGLFGRIAGAWTRFQNRFSDGMERFIQNVYQPVLDRTLEWRYLTIATGLTILMLTVGLIAGGRIGFLFFPNVDADNVAAILTMPQGTPVDVTAEAIKQLEKAALQLQKEYESETNQPVFRHIIASIGEQPFRASQNQNNGNTASFSAAHLGEINIELEPSEIRGVGSTEIAERWRELTGPIPDAVELIYTSSLFSAGEAIHIQFRGPDYDELQTVAQKFKDKLRTYPGVNEIADTFRPGKKEVKLSLTKQAETLGLTLSDLARQVRQAFYGEEAQRIQRGRDDIRVMVRYPAKDRRSLGNLENMRIRTPNGGEVPFSLAAEADLGRGFASIRRSDRQKAISVMANVDQSKANANEILADVTANFLPQLMADHPRIRYSFEGEQRQQQETLSGLAESFGLALLIIYILLAVPFKSYVQPLIVMSAIPFGLVGAVWGHILMGMDLTILSIFGIVALTGVVVNDSLVMVDFINRRRLEDPVVENAIRQAGAVRFRPIILTSITTFASLIPLLLEKSLQAQFLIPMATSLGFGVLFATLITLILVPVAYDILEDVKIGVSRLLGRASGDHANLDQAA
ncbi:MAG: efflux RND transporter permease subunit [bacterium]|nr:efflux RND transporter permease subunit [bacterium]